METIDYTGLIILTKKLLEKELQRDVTAEITISLSGSSFIIKFRNHFIYDGVKLNEFTNIVKIPMHHNIQENKLKVEFPAISVKTIPEDFYFNVDYYLTKKPNEKVPYLMSVGLMKYVKNKSVKTHVYISAKPHCNTGEFYMIKSVYNKENEYIKDNIECSYILSETERELRIETPYETKEYEYLNRAAEDISKAVIEIVKSSSYTDNDRTSIRFATIYAAKPGELSVFKDYDSYKKRYDLFDNPYIEALKDSNKIKLTV